MRTSVSGYYLDVDWDLMREDELEEYRWWESLWQTEPGEEVEWWL